MIDLNPFIDLLVQITIITFIVGANFMIVLCGFLFYKALKQ